MTKRTIDHGDATPSVEEQILLMSSTKVNLIRQQVQILLNQGKYDLAMQYVNKSNYRCRNSKRQKY
ncbi:MAG: hypothetical protein M5F18_00015 [Asgard group archaeon]|nr:hypothetical protein [Asgard group archaeon]